MGQSKRHFQSALSVLVRKKSMFWAPLLKNKVCRSVKPLILESFQEFSNEKKSQKPKITCKEITLCRKTLQIHIKTKRVGDRDRGKFWVCKFNDITQTYCAISVTNTVDDFAVVGLESIFLLFWKLCLCYQSLIKKRQKCKNKLTNKKQLGLGDSN